MSSTLVKTTRLEGLRLIFGEEPCVHCSHSQFPGCSTGYGVKPCGACKGAGRRGNGRCRACKDTYDGTAVGEVRDYDNAFASGPCPICHGTQVVAAQYHSWLSGDVLAAAIDAIGVRVTWRGQQMGGWEKAIGMVPVKDSLFTWMSVSDYGRTTARLRKAGAERDGDTQQTRLERVQAELEVWRLEIVEKLKSDRTQISKLATRDGVLAAEIVVSLATDGYSVFAMPRSEQERARILDAGACSRDVAEMEQFSYTDAD